MPVIACSAARHASNAQGHLSASGPSGESDVGVCPGDCVQGAASRTIPQRETALEETGLSMQVHRLRHRGTGQSGVPVRQVLAQALTQTALQLRHAERAGRACPARGMARSLARHCAQDNVLRRYLPGATGQPSGAATVAASAGQHRRIGALRASQVRPNKSLNRSANGRPAWPCGRLGSSSAARPSRPAAVARLALR